MTPVASHHAVVRAQQRGIPPDAIAWLCQYGATTHAGGRCVIRYFDQRSRRRLQRDLGHKTLAQRERALDTYLVVAEDGTIVTVGHRTSRIARP